VNSLKVTIDTDRCAGHGACVAACPEVFDLSDDGYAVVISDEISTPLTNLVHEAVSQCPEHAITAVTD
jgi:ferredoxin